MKVVADCTPIDFSPLAKKSALVLRLWRLYFVSESIINSTKTPHISARCFCLSTQASEENLS
ncbi:MAG: hypothetical protein QG568_15 [Patescibacteria group bacterium]|nr:hypothetical protein [Patescibacteria group bacterium]